MNRREVGWGGDDEDSVVSNLSEGADFMPGAGGRPYTPRYNPRHIPQYTPQQAPGAGDVSADLQRLSLVRDIVTGINDPVVQRVALLGSTLGDPAVQGLLHRFLDADERQQEMDARHEQERRQRRQRQAHPRQPNIHQANNQGDLENRPGINQQQPSQEQQQQQQQPSHERATWPLGADGQAITAKEDYGFTSRAIVRRPDNLPVTSFLNHTQIAACVAGPPAFRSQGQVSGDGRRDEKGNLEPARWIMTCKDCKSNKAKLRQSRPIVGQGDDYIVLQTKGPHHKHCLHFHEDHNGNTTFKQDGCVYIMHET